MGKTWLFFCEHLKNFKLYQLKQSQNFQSLLRKSYKSYTERQFFHYFEFGQFKNEIVTKYLYFMFEYISHNCEGFYIKCEFSSKERGLYKKIELNFG